MRVVIAGGGIAGLTLAARLRQQGRRPIVVEQAEAYGEVGYSLGLWPLGSCVFHGLGLYDQLLARSVQPETYELGDHLGRIFQRVPMTAVANFGDPILTVPRSDVMELLESACADVEHRMGTTISSVDQDGDVVAIGLSSGDSLEADLLVVAEGIHSPTRELVFGQVETYDTHWTLLSWWGEAGRLPETTMREYWGPGRLVGMYPCRTGTATAVGFPNDVLDAQDASTESVRSHLKKANEDLCEADPVVEELIDDATDFLRWPMTDVRSSHWSNGRVVVCGDAGAAFLPTAGVGASNALRSAAALADELSRAGAKSVPLALELYEKRCRPIIEANQHDSRSMAKYVFVKNREMSWARDHVMRHYPATKIVDDIIDSMRTPF